VTTKPKRKRQRQGPISLHPLKAEQALRLFMQVDPAKVEAGMRTLPHQGGRKPALSKA
jgi:hypothetical protein